MPGKLWHLLPSTRHTEGSPMAFLLALTCCCQKWGFHSPLPASVLIWTVMAWGTHSAWHNGALVSGQCCLIAPLTFCSSGLEMLLRSRKELKSRIFVLELFSLDPEHTHWQGSHLLLQIMSLKPPICLPRVEWGASCGAKGMREMVEYLGTEVKWVGIGGGISLWAALRMCCSSSAGVSSALLHPSQGLVSKKKINTRAGVQDLVLPSEGERIRQHQPAD